MVISKYNFSEVFAEAWMKALTPTNIVSGFKKCGIYPFNRDAIPVQEESMEIDEPMNDDSLFPSDNSVSDSTSPSNNPDFNVANVAIC